MSFVSESSRAHERLDHLNKISMENHGKSDVCPRANGNGPALRTANGRRRFTLPRGGHVEDTGRCGRDSFFVCRSVSRRRCARRCRVSLSHGPRAGTRHPTNGVVRAHLHNIGIFGYSRTSHRRLSFSKF